MKLIPVRRFGLGCRGRNARIDKSVVICHAMVSDEDYGRLSKYVWALGRRYGRSGTEYPRRWDNGRGVSMHLDVLPPIPGYETSHEDSNPLNNQRDNLVRRTRSWNRLNRKDRLRSDNKTGVRGLWWDAKRNAFQVYVTVDKKRIRAGRFAEKTEALAALDALLLRCGVAA